jgi:hypothetical protein
LLRSSAPLIQNDREPELKLFQTSGFGEAFLFFVINFYLKALLLFFVIPSEVEESRSFTAFRMTK